MDLTLSEEHEALRAVVEEFAHKEVAPVIGERTGPPAPVVSAATASTGPCSWTAQA